MRGRSEPPERRPVTEDQRKRAREVAEEVKQAMDEATKRPPAETSSPGKFTEPLGLQPDGSFQPPLTEQEKAHNEEVRRKARAEVRQAFAAPEEREDDGSK